MKVIMDKMLVCTKVYIKYYFAYPQNVYIKLLNVPVQLVFIMFLWSTVSDGTDVDIKNMITYYLLAYSVIYSYPFLRTSRNIGDDIFSGGVSNYLVRPVSYLYVTISKFMAWIIVYAIIFIPIMTFIYFFNGYTISRMFQFLILVLIGMFIEIFIWISIGNLTFYVDQIYGIAIMLNAVKNLLSGSLIPLNYLPNYIQTFAEWSPFKFLVFVPINFLQDNSIDFSSTLVNCLGCLVIIISLQQVLWKSGINVYQNNFS